MKLHWLFVLSMGIVFVLVACGASATSTTAPTLAPATAVPTLTPTPTLAPTPSPPPFSTATAILEVRVTAQPTDVVNSSLGTIRTIEVSVPVAPGEWSMVVAEPEQFDLLTLANTEGILGSSALEPGLYQRIRFDITEVVLNIRGNVRNADAPSEKLVLEGEFKLVAGETTVLTLNFDPDNSIFFRPGIGPQLDPAIKLLVRSASQSLAEAKTVATLGKEATPSPTEIPVPSSANTVRVAFPVTNNLQWMSFYVAQGAGFFEDEGIDVRIVVPPAPDQVVPFMINGRADVALTPRPLYLESIGRGEPVVIFANLFSNDPINLVVQKEVAEDLGISADMPLTERLNAMRGLRVGVAEGPPTRLRLLFDSVGLDADSNIEMVILHGDEQNPAFADGSIDALYAHTPYLERSLLKQGAVMIVNQSAGDVPELTNRQIHTLLTSHEYAASNPQVLLALTKAVYRAQQLIHTDLQATGDAIRSSQVQLQEPEGLDIIIAIYEPAVPQSPEVSVEGALRELGSFFPAHRTPPDFSGIDVTNHVDNQFAEAAVAGGS